MILQLSPNKQATGARASRFFKWAEDGDISWWVVDRSAIATKEHETLTKNTQLELVSPKIDVKNCTVLVSCHPALGDRSKFVHPDTEPVLSPLIIRTKLKQEDIKALSYTFAYRIIPQGLPQ